MQYSKTKEKQRKQEESRLITTLRMYKSEPMPKGMLKVSLPLSTPLDMGEHETSHSRWLKEKDKDNLEILIIEPLLPKGKGRRKSILLSESAMQIEGNFQRSLKPINELYVS